MLKFDANDIKSLEENSRTKLQLTDNNYKGSLFKQDMQNGALIKAKLKIVKTTQTNN